MKGGGANFDKRRPMGEHWAAFTDSDYSYKEAIMFNALENIANRHGYYSTSSVNLEDFLKNGRHPQLFGGQDINTLLSWISNDRVWYGDLAQFLRRLDESITSRGVVDSMHKDPKHANFTASLTTFRGLIDAGRHRADAARTAADVARDAAAAAAAAEMRISAEKRVSAELVRDKRFYDAYRSGGIEKLADEWVASQYSHNLFGNDQTAIKSYLGELATKLKFRIDDLLEEIPKQRAKRLDALKKASYLKGAGRKGKRTKRLSKRRAKKSKRVR
jgi:hypothetical protein